ncbi:MAG: hypothetical protein WCZ87_00935 [Thiohalobacteraceae bacterium]
MNEIPLIQRVVAILWPSFLMSGLATILFFAAFDPQHLLMGSRFAEMSRLGAYTLGFFLFWFLTSLTSALTCYFRRSCEKTNAPGLR